jgi:hypothetical protein
VIPAVSGGEQRPAAWRTLAPWTGSPRGGSEES